MKPGAAVHRYRAHVCFARLHEVFHPLVVDGGVDVLATAQFGHGDFSPYPFHERADLVFGGKTAPDGAFGLANQSASRLGRADHARQGSQKTVSVLLSSGILHPSPVGSAAKNRKF